MLREQISKLLVQAQNFPVTFDDVPFHVLLALITALEEVARHRMCSEYLSFPPISVDQLMCGFDHN